MAPPKLSARRAWVSYLATTVGGLLIATCLGLSLVEITALVDDVSIRCGTAWTPDLSRAGTLSADLCNAAVDERRSGILVLFPIGLALTIYGAITRIAVDRQ